MDELKIRSLVARMKSVVAASLLASCAASAHAADCPALLDRSMPRLQDEKPQNLCQYSGKVVVVVNTASYCGFTSQYKGLEALYARYRERGLVVLGFPSNDFGSQEPGSNQEIATFCSSTFGVKFPMFTKTRVSTSAGADVNPLYAELRKATGSAPRWNFHKYVIARDGKTAESYSALTAPDDKSFIETIDKLLAAP
ncbi:MAG: glutathione peroxidase [Burkholderiaceae bacterium]|nr:glutathione peroxidase [Burkholderiaceae bacterium]